MPESDPSTTQDRPVLFTAFEPSGDDHAAPVIAELKRHGVGRPSTYSSIMKTLKDRGYIVASDKAKKLRVTETGEQAVVLAKRLFPQFVSLGFTSSMEADLDRIVDGDKEVNVNVPTTNKKAKNSDSPAPPHQDEPVRCVPRFFSHKRNRCLFRTGRPTASSFFLVTSDIQTNDSKSQVAYLVNILHGNRCGKGSHRFRVNNDCIDCMLPAKVEHGRPSPQLMESLVKCRLVQLDSSDKSPE